MLPIFLKKNEVKKMHILILIIYYRRMTVNELSARLATSRSTTERLLHQLGEELKSLYQGRSQLYQDDYHRWYLADTLVAETIHPIQGLYQTYVNYSLSYQALKLMIKKEPLAIEELGEQLSISEAYCYSLLQKLNHYLEPHQLSISSNRGQLRIRGSEHKIFAFCYFFVRNELQSTSLTVASLETSWAVHWEELTLDNRLAAVSPLRAQALKLTLLLRKDQLKQLEIESADCRSILQMIGQEEDYFAKIKQQYTDGENDAQLFLNFFVRYFFPQIETTPQKINIANRLYHHPLVVLCQQLISSFSTYFSLQLSPDDYYELLASLVLECLSLQLFKEDMTSFFKQALLADIDLAKESSGLKSGVNRFMQQEKAQLLIAQCQSEDAYSAISHIFSTFLAAYQSVPLQVNIYIDYADQLAAERIVYRRLSRYYNQELLHYVDSPVEADLIISDYLTETPRGTSLFFIDNVSSNEMWSKIFQTIEEIVFRQYNQLYQNIADNLTGLND